MMTLCTIDGKPYALEIVKTTKQVTTKQLEHLAKNPLFAFTRKLSMKETGYYFILTQEQYKQKLQEMQNKIYKPLLDKIYSV